MRSLTPLMRGALFADSRVCRAGQAYGTLLPILRSSFASIRGLQGAPESAGNSGIIQLGGIGTFTPDEKPFYRR